MLYGPTNEELTDVFGHIKSYKSLPQPLSYSVEI